MRDKKKDYLKLGLCEEVCSGLNMTEGSPLMSVSGGLEKEEKMTMGLITE